MTDDWLFPLTLVAALGCGLVAGVFLAFSASVMRALATLPPAQGIAAMRSINVAVINPWFMGVLFGPAALCLAGVAWAMRNLDAAGADLLLAGSLIYLTLTIGVTMAFNVPLNDRLARTDPEGAEAKEVWTAYVTAWTRWNHVRTIGALAASACLILGLVQRASATGGPL